MSKYVTKEVFNLAVEVCAKALKESGKEIKCFISIPGRLQGEHRYYDVFEHVEEIDISPKVKGKVIFFNNKRVTIEEENSNKRVTLKFYTLKPLLNALGWSSDDVSKAVLEYLQSKEVAGVYDGYYFFGFKLPEFIDLAELLNRERLMIKTVEIKKVELVKIPSSSAGVLINGLAVKYITFKDKDNG